jgi:hypothetical protein
MTALLDPNTADRLAKLCGLFSSHHDGERSAAAQKADQLVRGLGLTWPDIILARWNARPTWADTIEGRISAVLATPDALGEWEGDFIRSINGRRRLSLKQRDILDCIVLKVTAYNAVRNAA